MRIKFISLFLLLSLALATICYANEWETISRNANQLKAVQADFIQEKHLKILARPIISKGLFIFQSPDSLRWEYKSPVKSLLLMHNGKSKKYIQRNGKLVEEHGINLESMQIILQEITNWLNGHFTDNPTFNASLENDHQIVFTPKDQAISRLINRIELKLSDQPGLLDSVTIFEGAASFTKLTFTNAEINPELKSSLFTEK
jgi:outer membrane lipoprotein-sorting protein